MPTALPVRVQTVDPDPFCTCHLWFVDLPFISSFPRWSIPLWEARKALSILWPSLLCIFSFPPHPFRDGRPGPHAMFKMPVYCSFVLRHITAFSPCFSVLFQVNPNWDYWRNGMETIFQIFSVTLRLSQSTG